MIGISEAPTTSYYYIRVRLTAYSPKERFEHGITALGKSARNETGAAAHKSFLPLGTRIEYKGQVRIIDDRIPTRSAKKFKYKVVDFRYFESITSKSKTRSVSKELKKRFDKGFDIIKIYR